MNILKIIGSFLYKFIILSLILMICVISKNQWCYLTLIILLAYCSGLLNKDFQDFLVKLFNKDLKIEELTNTEITLKEIKEKLDNISKPIEKENNKNFTDNYHEIAKRFEAQIINWFNREKNILFEQNKKIVRAKNTVFIPDGIFETRKKDIILEVKMSPMSYSSINSLLYTFKTCNEEYIKTNKMVMFYLVIASDNSKINNQLKLIEKAKREACFDNLKIFIFEKSNNNINLLKED